MVTPVGERRYLSYLLRLWQVKHNGDVNWRASLEDPRTGERRGFANLEALIEFLRGLIRVQEEEQNDPLARK